MDPCQEKEEIQLCTFISLFLLLIYLPFFPFVPSFVLLETKFLSIFSIFVFISTTLSLWHNTQRCTEDKPKEFGYLETELCHSLLTWNAVNIFMIGYQTCWHLVVNQTPFEDTFCSCKAHCLHHLHQKSYMAVCVGKIKAALGFQPQFGIKLRCTWMAISEGISELSIPKRAQNFDNSSPNSSFRPVYFSES